MSGIQNSFKGLIVTAIKSDSRLHQIVPLHSLKLLFLCIFELQLFGSFSPSNGDIEIDYFSDWI